MDFSLPCVVVDDGNFVGFVGFFDDLLGEGAVDLDDLVLFWEGEDDRAAEVAEFCDLAVEGYFHCVLDPELVDNHVNVSFSEYIILTPAAHALVVCHILYNSQYLNLEILEHLDTFDHVNKG